MSKKVKQLEKELREAQKEMQEVKETLRKVLAFINDEEATERQMTTAQAKSYINRNYRACKSDNLFRSFWTGKDTNGKPTEVLFKRHILPGKHGNIFLKSEIDNAFRKDRLVRFG